MDLYLSVDMEGVCGVTHPAQCRPGHPDYERFRRKHAIDRLTGRHLPVERSRALIAERAGRAVRRLATKPPAPTVVEGPACFEIEFRSTSAARFCLTFPGVERTSPVTVRVEHADYLTAFRHFWGLAVVGFATGDGLFSAS